jgi:hypothetical protein
VVVFKVRCRCPHQGEFAAPSGYDAKGDTPSRLRQYGLDEIVAGVERAKGAVAAILRQRWDDVERVAMALSRAEERRLTGEQVQRRLRGGGE